MKIPESLRKRIPLVTEAMYQNYIRLKEAAHAPRFNSECGDRLVPDDLPVIQEFTENLQNKRENTLGSVPAGIQEWIERMSDHSRYFHSVLRSPGGQPFDQITPMTREIMRERLADICPGDLSLDRLIVNPTSGTTGQPFMTPGHPVTSALYQPMILFALARHGVLPELNSESTAAVQVCAQKKTMTYCTVHTQANGAGFAKINIEASDWRHPEDCKKYLAEMRPEFLSGDPYAYLRLLEMNVKPKVKALLSTAIELDAQNRATLQNHFEAPLINFYSTNETGPIAYSCPDNADHFHILPHDIHVEITDSSGRALGSGQTGIITISGGRNPYLPLLRYHTGDFGKIRYDKCTCSDVTPRLYDIQFRKMVIFRTETGVAVNPVDISRFLKDIPLYAHRVFQQKNNVIEMTLYTRAAYSQVHETLAIKNMKDLFGQNIELRMIHYRGYPQEKIIPFERET